MIDSWHGDLIAIALAVSVVTVFALWQAPHLLRLTPGFAAAVITLVVVYDRAASAWLVGALVALWVVRDSAPVQVQAVFVAMGAGAVALEMAGEGTHLPWVVMLALPSVGAAVVTAGRRLDAEAIFVLLLLSALGQWAGAPDTTGTVVTVVVVAVFAADTLRAGGRIVAASLWPLAGIMIWASAYGSTARPTAMAGCLAAFGVLLAEPIRSWVVEAALARDGGPESAGDRSRGVEAGDDPGSRAVTEVEDAVVDDGRWEPPLGVLLAIQVPSVLVASRVAAVSDRPGVAVGVAAAVLAFDIVVLELVRRRLAGQRRPLRAR